MKAKYTPGPWSYDGRLIVDAGNNGLAHTRETERGDVNANTRLIAQAPQMYEFLKKHENALVNFFKGLEGEYSDSARTLKDLIKKVEE